MQLKVLPAFILFLGSYFPLSVILLLQDVEKSSWLRPVCRPAKWFVDCQLPVLTNPGRSIGFFLVCGLSLALFFTLLRLVRGQHVLKVEGYKAVPNDLINYVFPYVVAFMVLDFADTGKYYGFWLFLGWMFVITYRSGQILMNPLLIVAGWQLYEIDAIIDGDSLTVRAISRREPGKGKSFQYFGIQDIRVLLKEEPNGKASTPANGAPAA